MNESSQNDSGVQAQKRPVMLSDKLREMPRLKHYSSVKRAAVDTRCFSANIRAPGVKSRGRPQCAEPDVHAGIMVTGQILHVGAIQRVEPAEALAGSHFSDPEQRAVGGIALLHRAGVEDFQQAGPQIIHGR